MITDFIKLKSEHLGSLILNRSEISSVANTDDTTQNGEMISIITMTNGTSFRVIGSADSILMHCIGTRSV